MEDSELLRKRREKIDALKADGVDLYPNDVRVDHTTAEIQDRFGHLDEAALQDVTEKVSLAGRIIAIRNFGKAAFAVLQDRTGRLQVYIAKNILGDAPYTLFKRLDIGDIVFVAGRVFRTRTGELTVEANALRLLAKSLHPLPEKWHGLTDVEIRYRQRHLDLIVNPKVRDVFYRRSRIIQL
ncbi:MAG TPA: lysine--tRNA ligase, partial [Syntrophus sp. (in: bacteria)]|nr:lysine--tRNA ligase [Syntrophus sp. (in: bacteria)]